MILLNQLYSYNLKAAFIKHVHSPRFPSATDLSILEKLRMKDTVNSSYFVMQLLKELSRTRKLIKLLPKPIFIAFWALAAVFP